MAENILVTGGAGYVGSHACKALANAGYSPVTYDNLSRGHKWAVKWGPLEYGDIHDEDALNAVFRKYRPSAVLHFAALAYVGESVTDPGSYYWNNVAGTLRLLNTMRAHDVRHVVFSSTCSTFGVPKAIPIRHDAPQDPVNPYGTSKLTVERVLADYSAAYGMRALSLRYFNAAGADPDCEIGEFHDPETHLIPLVLYAAIGKTPSIGIHGTDYPTRDGTCIRDYIHVSDLASAHVRALQYLRNGGTTCAVNLGTGNGWSVKEVIQAARTVTERLITVHTNPRRPGDPPELVADPSRALEILDWKATYTSIEAIVHHAWRWLQHATDGRLITVNP